ncbi:hypothetical protein [Planococcus sp. ISL-109]|uniref:hypothetical protein n=1 Tax=Planococcus sp. ISL-109 TaxID=2819166 RepID=UPI001BE58237|nr:hypothetical protein [Planococcus sp. ISL-109]MBT2582222.1 hypothetical protein [Planococcus sp. ISL-109]
MLFYHVLLPHLLPEIAAGARFKYPDFHELDLITFIIGSGQVVTLPILLFPFISGGDPAVASAYLLLYAGIAILALLGMDVVLQNNQVPAKGVGT